nr:MAG TPA: Protein SeqA, Negative regulator, DNA replication.5A [Bacteriophage sp.]
MSHDLAIRRTFSGCFLFLKGRRRVYFAGNRYERAECDGVFAA